MKSDMETVISHQQIMHIWASFARERDLQFFTEKHLDSIIAWTDEAIALLKEQEAMMPGLKQDVVGIWNTCPRCGHILKSALYDPLSENSMFFHYPNYCEACGQAVKWE